MAIIRPFAAVRPPVHLAPRVAALPYDVMDVEEARQMAGDNQDSFLHISRPEIDLPPTVDPHADEVHSRGKQNLQQFLERRTLIQDPAPCYYIYRQRMGSIVQTGLVACSAVDDYQTGVIKKHEHTRADKEEDRVRHIDTLDANDEPVFYIFRNNPEVEEILASAAYEQPDYHFTTDDGVSHTLWVVGDPALIDHLTGLFEKIPTLYVADGHHRSAAAARVRDLRKAANPGHTGTEEYNFFLTVIFPESQLNIMPYNRVVKDLHGLSCSAFLEQLAPAFEIATAPDAFSPTDRHQFGMYLERQWYQLRVKPGVADEGNTVGRLDVSILQNRLLHPVLGIENPRTDKRISFVGGIRGVDELVRLVDSGEYAVAFSLFPTGIKELMELADDDQIMPPKSTWFEPKLRSGLFVHLLS
ncbi:MAG: DUF1015 domain-containing protein [Geobacter sp.]|nr:DUF1015 domain-containing protein [Geobacter sp.]